MSEELKPCPFCGGSVEMNDYTDKPACAWVLIHRCNVIGPIKLVSYSGESLRGKRRAFAFNALRGSCVISAGLLYPNDLRASVSLSNRRHP